MRATHLFFRRSDAVSLCKLVSWTKHRSWPLYWFQLDTGLGLIYPGIITVFGNSPSENPDTNVQRNLEFGGFWTFVGGSTIYEENVRGIRFQADQVRFCIFF